MKYLEEMEVKGKITQTSFELLAADTTNKVMDYYGALHREIKRLGGKAPDSPKFDEDTLVRATVTRMVQDSRMMLHKLLMIHQDLRKSFYLKLFKQQLNA